MTLLYLDLDGFKPVNDEFGHDVGDELLVAVGERLTSCTRAADIVARLGGDEFAVLLDSPTAPGDVDALSERLEGAFARPFVIEGRGLRLGASVGRAVYPDDADGAEGLLRAADRAMFEAKRGVASSAIYPADHWPHRDQRLHTGARAGIVERRAHTGAAREADERPVAQPGHRDARASRQQIGVSDGGDKLIIDQNLGLDVARRGIGEPDEREVEATISQRPEELVGVVLRQRDLDPGMRPMERVEQARKIEDAAGDDHADRYPSTQQPRMFLDGQPGACRSLERRAGVRQYRSPHLGEANRSR